MKLRTAKKEDLRGRYKVLTIWQPYASLIAVGAKRIETRGWSTRYRGQVLIHAAKRWDNERADDFARVKKILGGYSFESNLPGNPGLSPMGETLGKVLCIAELVDCTEMPTPPQGTLDADFGWFGPGRFGWQLESVRPFDPPFELRGQQGLWEVTF